MELSLWVAIIGIVGTIINSFLISNSKFNGASAKKANAEADKLIYDLKNETIKDLQSQIDELKAEILMLKKQEFIHIKEKVRLEQIILNLTEQNETLRKSLETSSKEISHLTKQIDNLRLELNSFKNKHRVDEKSISDSRTS